MSLPPRVRIAVAWLPAIAYTLLIWWLSSRALDVAFLRYVPFQDKGVHFLEYAALCFFIVHAATITWGDRPWGGALVAVLMTTGAGLLDEVHQAFVPGRQADTLDLLADALGALLGVLLYVCASRLRRALRRSHALG